MAAEDNKSPSLSDECLENVVSEEVDAVVAALPQRGAIVGDNNRYARVFDHQGNFLYKVDGTNGASELATLQFIPLGGGRIRIRSAYVNRFCRTTQNLNNYVHANGQTGLEQGTVFEVVQIGDGNVYAFKHVLTNRYLTRDTSTSGVLRDTLRATSVSLVPAAHFRVFNRPNSNNEVSQEEMEALAQAN